MSVAEVWVRSSSMKMYDGQELELGEVFNLRNGLNDDKLLEHRFVVVVDKATRENITECISCTRRFASETYRNAHSLRAQHEAIEVDGPQLKRPSTAVDPTAEGADRPLEPAGAPAVPNTGLIAGDRGSRRGASGPGSKANEVIRFGN